MYVIQFLSFFEFYSKYSCIYEYFKLFKLKKARNIRVWKSKYSSLKFQFRVELSSSFGFKLEKARFKNTLNILSIFELFYFESSYALPYNTYTEWYSDNELHISKISNTLLPYPCPQGIWVRGSRSSCRRRHLAHAHA